MMNRIALFKKGKGCWNLMKTIRLAQLKAENWLASDLPSALLDWANGHYLSGQPSLPWIAIELEVCEWDRPCTNVFFGNDGWNSSHHDAKCDSTEICTAAAGRTKKEASTRLKRLLDEEQPEKVESCTYRFRLRKLVREGD